MNPQTHHTRLENAASHVQPTTSWRAYKTLRISIVEAVQRPRSGSLWRQRKTLFTKPYTLNLQAKIKTSCKLSHAGFLVLLQNSWKFFGGLPEGRGGPTTGSRVVRQSGAGQTGARQGQGAGGQSAAAGRKAKYTTVTRQNPPQNLPKVRPKLGSQALSITSISPSSPKP